MKNVVTVGDMSRLEQAAVQGGLTFEGLMERAGTVAAEVFTERFADAAHVLILCGNGNNGGDGFVMARHLVSSHRQVTVLLMSGEPQTSLAQNMYTALCGNVVCLSLPTEDPTTFLNDPRFDSVTHIVDAVYGIGFHGRLPAAHRAVFDRVRAWQVPVLAVDIPSGVHADDGTFDPATLHASVTVTFTAEKPCTLVPTCAAVCGELHIASVGIDEALCRAFETPFKCLDSSVCGALPPRISDSHKGSYGRLLSVCGSYGMAGAAILAGRAALRMGLGLLYAALPRSIYPIVAAVLPEGVYKPLPETDDGTLCETSREMLESLSVGKTAILCGCGLSATAQTGELLRAWVPLTEQPLLLDADGLNAFSEHILLLKARTAPTVITPHPAEAARLLSTTVKQIERDRFAAAKTLASVTGAVTVLKGHRTLIASPNGHVFMNMTGCSGLATGGSGDVLSGMIASLLAQGVDSLKAACCGVYLHGLCSEMTARRLSETAMLPTDMLEDLASLLSQFEMRE